MINIDLVKGLKTGGINSLSSVVLKITVVVDND